MMEKEGGLRIKEGIGGVSVTFSLSARVMEGNGGRGKRDIILFYSLSVSS